ncbi:MAG: membrane integrity-associated transporter subunit PqiC [Magnetococcales bacterium]|nr:membrane integrity-associated transporter subunit PqiC [Magnetococcales bacterium]
MSIKTGLFRWVGVLLPLLVCSACLGGSPPVRYFLLTPMAKAATPATSSGVDKPLLVVEPVEIPPYLNRPQIVTRSSENHLDLAQSELWGDNLRENISRVLLENLSALLGTDRIASPTSLPQERPALRIVTQVSQFERGADGRIVLRVRWRLVSNQTGKTLAVQQGQFVSEPVEADNYEGIATSMSGLLLQWSQEMAGEIAGYVR